MRLHDEDAAALRRFVDRLREHAPTEWYGEARRVSEDEWARIESAIDALPVRPEPEEEE